jgi:nitroreductase
MNLTHHNIKKAIIKSQHCYRNYDLTKTFPKEDLELIVHAAINCPSKQNIAYYKLHVITDHTIIKKIYNATDGFIKNHSTGESTTNSQALANLLLVFEAEDYINRNKKILRNEQMVNLQQNQLTESDNHIILRDIQMATGIAAGYVNLTSSILGYGTGFCACFNENAIRDVINVKNKILLLMGIGFKNKTVNRRMHPETGFIFPAFEKQEIQVNYV